MFSQFSLFAPSASSFCLFSFYLLSFCFLIFVICLFAFLSAIFPHLLHLELERCELLIVGRLDHRELSLRGEP